MEQLLCVISPRGGIHTAVIGKRMHIVLGLVLIRIFHITIIVHLLKYFIFVNVTIRVSMMTMCAGQFLIEDDLIVGTGLLSVMMTILGRLFELWR